MQKIGISLYADYYSLEECQQKIDYVKKLGYTEIFTSLNFAEYGFPNAKENIIDKQTKLLKYAQENGMRVHADITKNLIIQLGGSVNDLSCFADMSLPVIRLDSGFTDDEVAEMTKNPHGIIIEENMSNYATAKQRVLAVASAGNLKQLCGCHNFYPRVDTGIKLEDAIEKARFYHSYGLETGIFIGSLYSETEMNDKGSSVMTLEDHRYRPSVVQASELFAYKEFDNIIFGDTNPRDDEIIEVSNAFKLWDQGNGYIELPCYLDNIDDELKQILLGTTFTSRVDIPEKVIRACEIRGKVKPEPFNLLKRNAGSITIDNDMSNQYAGELEVPLVDLDPMKNINVIGQVKPYAYNLLNTIHNDLTPFRLKE